MNLKGEIYRKEVSFFPELLRSAIMQRGVCRCLIDIIVLTSFFGLDSFFVKNFF